MMARLSPELFDAELVDLPPEVRWREWMGRVEATIFASPRPVSRETLATLVGRSCVLDEIIADIRDELKGRPYELVAVAGGWQHRTRRRFADAIQRAFGTREEGQANLTATESLAVTAIAYFQPVTRQKLSQVLGREISRDVMARLKRLDMIGAGPRVAQAGAPLTYVTTVQFLSMFGLNSLRDLPDMEALEDAGLLTRDADDTVIADPLESLLGVMDD
jgi:segregation and condensation protein B